MSSSPTFITPQTLRAWFADRQEIAVIDVREELTYSTGHLLLAASLPLSRLELLIGDLVPRRGVRLCCCDDGEGLAERAAQRALALGYTQVCVLRGGLQAWRDAGHEVYTGVHVPSKAFAEVLEHEKGTPTIPAEELARLRKEGHKLLSIDTRTFPEFQVDSVPGSVSAPGGEVLLRLADLASDPDTTVVVNCGGRTRSIIGAQSLINAGVKNRVVSLTNGTMGWHLAGFDLDHGRSDRVPAPTASSLRRAKEFATNLVTRFAIRKIDSAGLREWRAQAAERTMHVLDVRSFDEYCAGHLEDAVWAPGGQLVQQTGDWVATLGARIVLVDDASQARAALAASWLIQMGWDDVVVMEPDWQAERLEVGARQPRAMGLFDFALASGEDQISPKELHDKLEKREVVVLDASLSSRYRARHVPASHFVVRARLKNIAAKLPSDRQIVVASDDGLVARYVAWDIRQSLVRTALVLDGGVDAWVAAGLPTQSGLDDALDTADDVWYVPRDRESDRERAMQEYIDWELALVAQVNRDPDCRFRLM